MQQQRKSYQNNLLLHTASKLVLLSLLLSGCIKPVLPQRVITQVSPTQIHAIKGKTIGIDPGHGGPERGAVGKNGLHEAEVNLGVALYLWGFLKQAGANPVLTRTTDTSVTQQEEFNLRQELRARAEIAHACQADLFLSLHHNADEHNTRRDEVIIFYKISDSGCSRDVAREISAALSRYLKPQKASIQPGNFHVLRAARIPAVLGEASFITTEKTATLLAYHRTLATEAAGYFEGICAYFQKGIPTITKCSPDNSTVENAHMEITCELDPGIDNASIEASSVSVRLDGEKLSSCSVQHRTLRCFPSFLLPNGIHRYCVTVRNTRGNISPEHCSSFRVALPAQQITVTPRFSIIPPHTESATPITIQVVDILQRPVADGTVVNLSTSGGKIEPNCVITLGGSAYAVLHADLKATATAITAHCGTITGSAHVEFRTPAQPLFLLRILDQEGRPLQGVELLRDGTLIGVSDGFGYVHEIMPEACTTIYRVQKKGYLPQDISASLSGGILTSHTVQLMPCEGGVFFNRVIMLDINDSHPGVKKIADELAARIDQAGGTAVYSWTGTTEPPDSQRALRASFLHANIFIRFEASKKPFVRYYYKSRSGQRVATRIADQLNENLPSQKKKWRVEEGSDYVLAHTEMTAIIIGLPSGDEQCTDVLLEKLYGALREFFADKSSTSQF